MYITRMTLSSPGARHGIALPGSGPVFRDQLNCGQSDDSLLNCTSFSSGEPPICDHSLDVSIQCRGQYDLCRETFINRS